MHPPQELKYGKVQSNGLFIKNKGYSLCIQPYATVFVYDGVCQITDLIYHVSPRETHNPDENVTVCCTVENQQNADKKLSVFRTLPIKHKCITAQPLIERVNLEPYLDGVELVVVGGESDKDDRLTITGCLTSGSSASGSRSISSSVNAERTSSRMAGSISSRPKTCVNRRGLPVSTTNARINNFNQGGLHMNQFIDYCGQSSTGCGWRFLRAKC